MEDIKHIPGYPEYHLTKDGRVFSTKRYPEGKEMKVQFNKKGYKMIMLYKKNEKHNYSWHTVNLSRLMWEVWNGTIPDGQFIRYKDSDKNNVSLDNLECVENLCGPRDDLCIGVQLKRIDGKHKRKFKKSSEAAAFLHIKQVDVIRYAQTEEPCGYYISLIKPKSE